MTDTVEDVVARLRAAGKAAVDAVDAEDAVDVCNEAEDLYPLAADLITSEHAARVAAEEGGTPEAKMLHKRIAALEARQAQLLEALREVVTVRDRAAFARARTLIKEMEGNG